MKPTVAPRALPIPTVAGFDMEMGPLSVAISPPAEKLVALVAIGAPGVVVRGLYPLGKQSVPEVPQQVPPVYLPFTSVAPEHSYQPPFHTPLPTYPIAYPCTNTNHDWESYCAVVKVSSLGGEPRFETSEAIVTPGVNGEPG